MDKVIVNGIKDKKSNIKKTKPGLNKQPEKTINSKTEYVWFSSNNTIVWF